MRVIFDIETYPNCFTLTACTPDGVLWWYYEISDWRNDRKELFEWLAKQTEMVGFNNVSFDYPVIHAFIQSGGKMTAYDLYNKASGFINAQDDDRFANIVWPSDRYVKQIDLYKIHHFDNKSRMTSLKALEFNMRLDNVEDLPFPVGSLLTRGQAVVLREYNRHDVEATRLFYLKSLEQIQFREELSMKHGKDFLNHNDVKIGKEIFQMSLESAGVQCYEYGKSGRSPKQSKRDSIALRECVPSYIKFDNPGFQRIHQHFLNTTITKTKGVFDGLIAHVGGLDYVFGTGGLHASVENRIFEADDEMMILDLDVTSMYPSIAISNRYYPEHLSDQFVDTYIKLKEDRVRYPKGSAENAMLKLALNGVYGASNDQFSVFYDPKFTMSVTITGQLCLAMLVDHLSGYAQVIQCNTDGVTIYFPRSFLPMIESIYGAWEKTTMLQLEHVEYQRILVADVNSYIAQKLDGKTKRKGRYEYDTQWHQNASALVVPKVAEKVLLEGASIAETVTNWPNLWDFFCRVKVPRSSRLEGDGQPLPNMLRYYVAKGGVTLTKIMPPLPKKPDVWRRFSVESGWTVCPCNDVKNATLPVEFSYYINEVEKLCLPLKEK